MCCECNFEFAGDCKESRMMMLTDPYQSLVCCNWFIIGMTQFLVLYEIYIINL
jgi:hypothetical protein